MDLDLFSSTAVVDLKVIDIFLRLGISLVFGLILSLVVQKYSPRGTQQGVPVLIGLLTFIGASLVILIGGSIVLTLGLVGGLSAVRFRTAIKEPVDIAFIFIGLIIGIGTGAGMIVPSAIVAVLFCIAFIWYSILLKQKIVLRVRAEVSKEVAADFKGVLNRCKGCIVHKLQTSVSGAGQEVTYVEFDIVQNSKNLEVLRRLSNFEGLVSFSFDELQQVGDMEV